MFQRKIGARWQNDWIFEETSSPVELLWKGAGNRAAALPQAMWGVIVEAHAASGMRVMRIAQLATQLSILYHFDHMFTRSRPVMRYATSSRGKSSRSAVMRVIPLPRRMWSTFGYRSDIFRQLVLGSLYFLIKNISVTPARHSSQTLVHSLHLVYPPVWFTFCFCSTSQGRTFPISLAMSSSSTHNRNPEGKNQYGVVCESSNFTTMCNDVGVTRLVYY